MSIEQIYTVCLAQGAYFIESDGEAVVIDPLREPQPYLERAKKAGARIKYIFETHFHADFVSGHLELANETGATIVYGPSAETAFNAHIAKDGECFVLGKLSFVLLHTPGHTMESSCFLLRDEAGKDVALFTGDTLFIGDVGRPDLAQNSSTLVPQETLAGLLYESLHNRICHLADDVIIYPAHGAGSACGKNMNKETSDTLGNQKKTNYALRSEMTKMEFVQEVTAGLQPPPAYFPINVQLNREGVRHLQNVVDRSAKALSLADFERLRKEEDAILLDTRAASDFAIGFIPGSINIGLDGSFAPWVGSLIPYKKQPILLIADKGRENEVITRLSRIGYDDAIGYMKGGFYTWREAKKPVDWVDSVKATEFAQMIDSVIIPNILDVRKEGEFGARHLKGAINLPLDRVNELQLNIDKSQHYYVHCAGGYRSMIFISILKKLGHKHLVDIQGGFNALKGCSSLAMELAP